MRRRRFDALASEPSAGSGQCKQTASKSSSGKHESRPASGSKPLCSAFGGESSLRSHVQRLTQRPQTLQHVGSMNGGVRKRAVGSGDGGINNQATSAQKVGRSERARRHHIHLGNVPVTDERGTDKQLSVSHAYSAHNIENRCRKRRFETTVPMVEINSLGPGACN